MEVPSFLKIRLAWMRASFHVPLDLLGAWCKDYRQCNHFLTRAGLPGNHFQTHAGLSGNHFLTHARYSAQNLYSACCHTNLGRSIFSLCTRVSTILERYYFGKRLQREGECIENYVTDLRRLASSCKFGVLTDERISDQFILGCHIEKVREELWLRDEPPLEKVLAIAKKIEHSSKCVDAIKNDTSNQVCAVAKSTSNSLGVK
ncbi:hypothetical protein NDU88_001475 [Pleurodeles waltl]|uniref:Retrotransposon gag domain-containing protein n=1 Tax=Pleurodeles waltl TaxID=8319 RepID=A0AAV7VC11_PLEWA|nr:hypothetical protein NDU88_001475 [Pleurodeles waltl]